MKQINRREFLKTLGLAGAAVTGVSLASCGGKKEEGDFNPNGTDTSEIPTDKMEYRSFPNLGEDKVSLLGYGCMRWPMVPDPNNEGRDIIDQEQVNQLVDYALAHGVNYFDSSPVYCQGQSEKCTGIALARHPRESYYIATKASNFFNSEFDNSVLMYKKSLEYFQTDYIDYYLLHSLGGGGAEAFKARFVNNGLLDYFYKEKQAGHIRHLGFSFHGNEEAWDYLMQLHDEGTYKWDFVQIQMNYVDWENASGRNTNAQYLYSELDKREIPVVIMEPLLGGRLSKLPNHVVARLKQAEPTKSSASWAFRWLGNHPRILTILSGMTYMEHLQDNLRSFCPFKPLNEEEMKFLADTAKIISEYPTIPCNDCKYCMPCPYGLDIPAILTHFNKMVNEGSVPEDAMDPKFKELRKRYLISYDRQVPKVRQASHCVKCGQCEPHCPQQIRIVSELERIDKLVEGMKQGNLGIAPEGSKS